MKGSTRVYISIGIALYVWVSYWLFPMDMSLLVSNEILNVYEIIQVVWVCLHIVAVFIALVYASIFLAIQDFGISKKLDKWFKL